MNLCAQQYMRCAVDKGLWNLTLTILDLPSCVASQLKWRVAVQLRDYMVSKLAGYIGSWRLVRLISASLSKIFGTSIAVLITPIPAKFWACVVPKRTIEYPTPNYHVVSHVCLSIFTCSVNSCMSMWVDLSAYCICVEQGYVLWTMLW